MTIEEILENDPHHAFSPDGETLYTSDGNVYHVAYDYHSPDELSGDYSLISDYVNASDEVVDHSQPHSN